MAEAGVASGMSSTPEFVEFDEGAVGQGAENISLLYDLTLPVSIELGRTRMTVQEVLALTRGSVIQLDRLVGEAIDIFVGERRFAQGEVVVLGEQFGVRITRILAQPSAEGAGE
jgi:flagellar motor switch protein FliN/FliY